MFKNPDIGDNYFRRITFRPSASPSLELPMGARSVGHYNDSPESRNIVAVKYFVQIFWTVKGGGIIVIDGEERELKEGQAAIYYPGAEHKVYAITDEWEYRWWTMDGPRAVEIAEDFGLRQANIINAGAVPEELFDKLEKAIIENTPSGERRASSIAYRLTAEVAGGTALSVKSGIAEKAQRIIKKHWNNPFLGVESIAGEMNIHRSVLSRKFKEALGVSPTSYIINLRVQNAMSQLKQSTKSVAEIASDCGWTDPNYFSRCIKKVTGLSPASFRRN